MLRPISNIVTYPVTNSNRSGQFCMLVIAVLLVGCIRDKDAVTSIGSEQSPYEFVKPENFPDPTYTFSNNPISKEGFELGKKLFFDPQLSRDGSVSCNNCHIQATGFADSQQHPLSIGVDNRIGMRNAPSLTNLAFMENFFWDGGVTHLDFVPLNAIESEIEMDEMLSNVVRKLNDDREYPELFKQAFGADSVSLPHMLQALSQFNVMMVSANSKYDKYVRNEGAILNNEELAGRNVFQAKCATCHSGELFTDHSFKNNGLADTFPDSGRERITEAASDIGKFRIPSLRNVARTAPYMHNAKFWTLEEVLDHYESGVIDSPTLAPELKQNGQLGISLTEEEKRQIIDFLETLSDFDFVADTKFMVTQ
ncbi:MAG: cytochrome-c peroxidase [Calditrichia bacterium]